MSKLNVGFCHSNQKCSFPLKLLVFLSLLVLVLPAITFSQEEWKNYTSNRMVWCLAIEGNYLWQGTMGGVVRRSITNPLTDAV